MATTKLSLYNGALRIIKETKLATLTDDRPERYALDDEYEEAIEYMLGEGLWNFAIRTGSLEKDTSQSTEFGYANVFTKPSDFIRLHKISANERFSRTLDSYEDEKDYWVADVDPLYISYVSSDANYGGDLSKWTAQFTRAVKFELANRIAGEIASFSEAEMDALDRKTIYHLRNARSKDVLGQAAMKPPVGRLAGARFGSTSRYREGSSG